MLKIAYVIAFLLESVSFSRWFIPSVKSIVGFDYFTHWSWAYVIYTLFFLWFVFYAFLRIVEVWRKQVGDKKNQLSFFMLAALMGFVNGSLAFVPVYDIPLPQYNLFLIPFYPFMMAYAIMRRGLLAQEEVLAIHRDKLALIGLLSSSINHEIKNPLFILQELSRKSIQDLSGSMSVSKEEIMKSQTKMSEQIARMRTLVERLGEFGKASIDTKGDVDIKQAIENALYFASQELRDHRVTVELKIADNLPILQGSKSQFEEIFLNLFINAYHAMPNGGTLTITAKQSLEITISDTGTGIAKDELKNIFKPFYTTKQKTGTGLGLHIVKTLVEQNNGKISVESEMGKGTIFSLTFKVN